MAITFMSISDRLTNIAFGNHRQALLVVGLEPLTTVADFQADGKSLW